jgi:hypothetical protein
MESTGDSKKVCALHAYSLRNLVEQINAAGIQKEDIACFTKDSDTFFLLYYK